MGDLPDWTQSFANAGATLASNEVTSGSFIAFSVSGNASLVILASGSNNNTKVCIVVQYFVDSTESQLVNTQNLNGVPLVGEQSSIAFETPVYAGWIVVANVSGQTADLDIVGASRTVPYPRILNDTNTARVFGFAGNIVSGTNYTYVAVDEAGDAYASNALTDIFCSSNTAGELFYQFVDAAGTLRVVAVGALTGSVNLNTRIGLPQGVINFLFAATANNATGTTTLILNPSQL